MPIPGTKHPNYLEENIAADAIELANSQMGALDAALAPGKVAGQRYSDWIMATIDR